VVGSLPKPLEAQGSYGETPSSVAQQLPTSAETEPDLARIIAAWPELSEPIRRAILALIESAR
jgi:hypothetical protein